MAGNLFVTVVGSVVWWGVVVIFVLIIGSVVWRVFFCVVGVFGVWLVCLWLWQGVGLFVFWGLEGYGGCWFWSGG